MRTVTGIICSLIIVSAVTLGWARQRRLVELQQQNAALQKPLAELECLKPRPQPAADEPIDTNELQRLRGETDALMKLRAEIGRLHQVQRLVVPELQQQVTSTLAQAEAANKTGEDLTAWREAELKSRDINGQLSSLVGQIRTYAAQHGGRLPRSGSELESLASLRLPDLQAMLHESNQRLLQIFEFMPQERELTTNDPVELLVREIKPRPLPDGSWARYYVGSGGSADQVVSKSGDFADYEKACHTGRLRQWLEKNER